jgi:sphingomyelin phosphodiesterase acid-like 3
MKNLFLALIMALPLLGHAQSDSVLVLSDVHLDLNLKPTSFYHTDTDTTLFLSTVSNAGAGKFPFILMPGDFLQHDNTHDTGSMTKTFRYIIDHVQKIDTNAIILPALGNNDCERHNTPDTVTYRVFYNSMLKRIDKTGLILKTFVTGGYYNYTKGDLSVIVLNTLVCAFGQTQEAKKEMIWLGKTLQDDLRENKKVWLVYHIPPGIDRYSKSLLWDAGVQKMYVDTIKKYAAIIKLQLAGHTHMDDCRLITDSGKLISYIAIAPGLDTRNGNNPAYQVIIYNRPDKTTNEVRTWYTDSANPYTWHSFSFKTFDFDFLLHYDSGNKDGRDYVTHYSTNRPLKSIRWDADFCAKSIIKTN